MSNEWFFLQRQRRKREEEKKKSLNKDKVSTVKDIQPETKG